jgi:hypothetical protein
MEYVEQLMFVAGAISLRPDIRDLRSIGVQGKFLVQGMMSKVCRAAWVHYFDNGLDRCAICRVALAPPASGVDRKQ